MSTDRDDDVAHTWNHRVIESVDTDGSPWFAIHEVHYKNDKPTMYTDNPVPVCGETLEELAETIGRMQRCLEYPILKQSDFQ